MRTFTWSVRYVGTFSLLSFVVMCRAYTADVPLEAFSWRYTHDSAGRTTRIAGPLGETGITYQVDASGTVRSLSMTLPDDGKISCTFDRYGRRTAMTDAVGKSTYEYDRFGNLASVSRDGAPILLYTHDTMGRVTSMETGGRIAVRYSYDFLGRVSEIDSPAGTISYEYQTGKRMVIRTLPNGTRTIMQYGPNGRLVSITHLASDNQVLLKFSYAYRPDGLIGEIGELNSRGESVVRYEYDTMQRLVGVANPSATRDEFHYDEVGNRTGYISNGKTIESSTFDWAGRLSTHNGEECKHDRSGNLSMLVREDDEYLFEYDATGLLRSAGRKGHKVEYAYDGDGNTISRTQVGESLQFVCDITSETWRPILATDARGRQTIYVWDGDVPVAQMDNGTVNFFLQDHVGSVRATVDARGTISAPTDYSPFGIPRTGAAGNFGPGFAGLFYDPATRLYLTRSRSYMPATGRFLQREPKPELLVTSLKDLSPYLYCGSDPVNFVDTTGGKWMPPPYQPVDLQFTRRIFSQPVVRSPEPLNERPRPSSDSFLDWTGQLLDVYGQGSYWIGARRSGSLGLSNVRDDKGRFPLGNTTGPTLNPFDRVARWHDIQDYVNWHAPKGTIVAVPDRMGRVEYFRSFGEKDFRHNLTVIPMAIAALSAQMNVTPFTTAAAANEILPIQIPMTHADAVSLESIRPRFSSAGGESPLYASNVGGVYLGGVSDMLDGLGQFTGIAYDEGTGRLILVGEQAGEVGLPSMRLDDLVTIFRSVYERGDAPYVSIDPNPADPEGPIMILRHAPGTENTYVGWVMFEADRVMKSYSLGEDNISRERIKLSVDGYANLFDLGFSDASENRSEPIWERFWIVPNRVVRRQSNDKTFTAIDVPLKVNTQRMVLRNGKLEPAPGGTPSKSAAAFSQWFTTHYDEIAHEASVRPPDGAGVTVPVAFFAELQRFAAATAAAEALRDQGVPMPSWMREYSVKPCPIPPTTPAIIVRASVSGPPRGGSSRTSVATQRIYGGVSLAVADNDRSVSTADVVAENLSKAMAGPISAAEPFAKVAFAHSGKNYIAVPLPGDSTRDIGACNLAEVDMSVPVQCGAKIELRRHFCSFFSPNDLFGHGWTFNAPRLYEQPEPTSRSGAKTTLKIGYRLVSPLNSVAATFRESHYIEEAGGELLVPTQPGAILGLAETTDERIGLSTKVAILRDGRRWHFDKDGYYTAQEESPLVSIYRRDDAHRVVRIEGWYGKALRAEIRLEYNADGLLEFARGSNDETVHYIYGSPAQLTRVEGPSGTIGYAYVDGAVAAVTRDGKTIRTFEYGARGKLRSETDADGKRTLYTSEQKAVAASIAASDGIEPHGERVTYDHAFRPVSHTWPDGTNIEHTYAASGAIETTVTLPGGERYQINRMANGTRTTWKFPEVAGTEIEYDLAGRRIATSVGGTVVEKRQWRSDGQLITAMYESVAMHFEYSVDGLLEAVLVTPPVGGTSFQQWLRVEIDPLGRPVKLTDYTGANTAIGYDQSGAPRLWGAPTEDGTALEGTQIERDSRGNAVKIQTSWGDSNEAQFDAPSGECKLVNIMRMGREAAIQYEHGKPISIRGFDGGNYNFKYIADASKELPEEVRTPNGLKLKFEYNTDSSILGFSCGELYRVKLEFDAHGRVVTFVQSPGQS
jgi:RHS repeat-associated protein